MDGEIVAIGQTEYGTFKAQADKAVIANSVKANKHFGNEFSVM